MMDKLNSPREPISNMKIKIPWVFEISLKVSFRFIKQKYSIEKVVIISPSKVDLLTFHSNSYRL